MRKITPFLALLACGPALAQTELVKLEPLDPALEAAIRAEPIEVKPDEPLSVVEKQLSLRRAPVPRPSNLAEFIQDEKAAVALGKALFWDAQVSSDGVQACASCHFHAGADNRSRGQLSPGLLLVDSTGKSQADRALRVGTMIHQLAAADFPFRRLADPANRASAVIREANDVVGSQGVRSSDFGGLQRTAAGIEEVNQPVTDPVFSHGGKTVRRVTPRNAPTVINAVYNTRNFWDGRAQSTFNGVNGWGRRDAKATVWHARTPVELTRKAVAIDNASLASQAVGPALSSFEMSGAGRDFPDLGKRLLPLRPLALQQVHAADSVLGTWAAGSPKGLTVASYADLVRRAFRREWWQSLSVVRYDGMESAAEMAERRRLAASNGLANLDNPNSAGKFALPLEEYTQMEANFSLFFGLAIQMYEATLVSNDAPIDRYSEGNATALTAIQKQGMALFHGKARCDACHGGPVFTAAANLNLPADPAAQEATVELSHLGLPQRVGIYDNGFYNIGVRPIREDLGLGANDPFGYPLAEARLLKYGLEKKAALTGRNDFFFVFPTDTFEGDGFFKSPTLRNVELTAPYFHNGGTLTLEQVVEFYNRGGDFNENGHNPAVRPLGLTAAERDALVQFLKSLTDDRVRYDRAPFDHPQLRIPNGVTASANGTLTEQWIELPAVGAAGNAEARRNFLQ
jgi:cytochrome c peroxidase